MNTKELAIEIADAFGISVRMAERIIRFATDKIKDTVRSGGAVRLAQFGSVPAHGTVKFNASGYFKELLK